MDPVTIPTGPAEHPILDYAALQRQGMAELERLASDQWTDFNDHDPGITFLDGLCYALLDLGYRIFHPVQDLLAEAGPDVPLALYSPSEALTTRAVTPDDLRRVVLDVPGVKNAWLEKVTTPAPKLLFDPAARTVTLDEGQPPPPSTHAVAVTGLWRVLVEKSDLEDVDTTALLLEVARRLHAHRPLCEDFDDIVVLDPMPIAVNASVEIGETENGETVLLGILERLDALISPAVRFKTLDQALAGEGTTDTVFDGPALRRGFIDVGSLPAAERRTALHASDVIREIMAAPGVLAVRSIALGRAGDPATQAWSLPLGESGAGRLDITASNIELVKQRMPVGVDLSRVKPAFAAAVRAARLFPELPPSSRDLPAPAGRKRDVTAYIPLEADLPPIYGLGAGALPDSAGAERMARANQLRGYLTLFDQLLANEYAQLGLMASLFSASSGSPRSYAAQLVSGQGSAQDPLLMAGFDQAALDKLVEPGNPAASVPRLNRFLNHLLARFGEAVTDDPRVTNAGLPAAADVLAARLLDAKREFLRGIPRLGAARGTGVNYLRANPMAPALVERVRLRLGLPESAGLRFLVAEHILLRELPEDAINALPLLEAASRADPWSCQLSFVFPSALKPLQALIERVTRDETPAHLAAYLIWLDEGSFARFAAAYGDLLTALRRHRLADKLGANPDAVDAPEAVS